jgi:hypothetical protein
MEGENRIDFGAHYGVRSIARPWSGVFRVVPTGGGNPVRINPGKPEQITPAKTVTDTGIAPYIFFEGA